MKFENKQLLIFDLDGTLINSALDLALAVNYMLETLGRETFSEEIIHGWVGNGALTLVKRALSGSRTVDDNLDEPTVEKALKIFLDYYEKNLCNATVPYPHIISTLKTLHERYTLAIVTNKPFAFVSPILKSLEMDGLFALILGGDSLPQKKPHPMPLLHVCDTLGVPVEASVMVGDSKNDILAANACGMDSVGVTYGYNYGEDIGVHKPTVIIDDFSELLELL
ncbi:phosphoglycolate phosphatase [Sulfurovum lithotrophicum]|nr:phosphoglycolate phosphatase [Sulfurovum lithotrophicum]